MPINESTFTDKWPWTFSCFFRYRKNPTREGCGKPIGLQFLKGGRLNTCTQWVIKCSWSAKYDNHLLWHESLIKKNVFRNAIVITPLNSKGSETSELYLIYTVHHSFYIYLLHKADFVFSFIFWLHSSIIILNNHIAWLFL